MCLGAMMFGPWGNPDHEESIRVIQQALDAGISFVDKWVGPVGLEPTTRGETGMLRPPLAVTAPERVIC